MNIKFTKIMSVLATVAIVASTFVWALPVAAANPGDGKFAIQDLPKAGTTGKNVLLDDSEIVDIAVASDGKTIYVAEGEEVDDYLYKSTDAGQSFEAIMGSGTTAYTGNTPTAIAVAPDDVNTVVVTDGFSVFLTKDAGTTWSELPEPASSGYIVDIAVAPARSGTLLGREYFIAIVDTDDNDTTDGDLLVIGADAVWDDVNDELSGNYDFTSVVVTPNFLGDRCIVAIGTDTDEFGATKLFVVNTATETVVNNNGDGVALDDDEDSGTTTDYGSNATAINSSSIALPSNFDATTSSGRRAYVGIASVADFSDNDVYRVENDGAKALGAVTEAPVYTVAYSGTIDSGILFMGPRANADIKYTTGMTGTSPTWTTSLKPPIVDEAEGAADPAITVRVASDYATTSRVFAGTMGDSSGLSISNDAGVSFVQESLIDTGADNAGSPSFTFASDAKTVYMTAKDAEGMISIWKSEVPFTPTSWSRIFAKASTGTGSFKMSGTAMYFAESSVTNGKIYVSQDSGISFSARNGPSGVQLSTYSLRDAQTVYYADTESSLYKSTNGAFFWGSPVAGGVGRIRSISLPKANQVIIAGTSVAISNDDGATFTLINGSLPSGSKYTLTTDSAYATNSILYTVDTGLTNAYNIYRVNTNSTSNLWESLSPDVDIPANDFIQGITCRSGVLYATSNTTATGIIRTLAPTDLIGNQNWQTINKGMPTTSYPGGGVTTTAGINLYVKFGNDMYAFNDFLATTKPTLTTPEDNFNNAVNPSGGNGYPVDLKWKPMGTGSGQVDEVDIEIVDKSNGLTGDATYENVDISPTNPVVTVSGPRAGVPFQPNKSYLWRIRAAHTTSDMDIDSLWSDARTINIQAGGQVEQQYVGPVQLGPIGAAAANVDPNNVGFAWAPVSGATEYQIVVSTDAALTKPVAGTPASVTIPAYQATGLAEGTTYFWAVKATKPTESVQTVGTFTTRPKAVVAPTPTGGTGGTQPTIIVQAPPAETPAYIWAVIAIGAILVIAVIILIVRTRRVP